jgi:hypothetical protein
VKSYCCFQLTSVFCIQSWLQPQALPPHLPVLKSTALKPILDAITHLLISDSLIPAGVGLMPWAQTLPPPRHSSLTCSSASSRPAFISREHWPSFQIQPKCHHPTRVVLPFPVTTLASPHIPQMAKLWLGQMGKSSGGLSLNPRSWVA